MLPVQYISVFETNQRSARLMCNKSFCLQKRDLVILKYSIPCILMLSYTFSLFQPNAQFIIIVYIRNSCPACFGTHVPTSGRKIFQFLKKPNVMRICCLWVKITDAEQPTDNSFELHLALKKPEHVAATYLIRSCAFGWYS
jgi:hypothetical protein